MRRMLAFLFCFLLSQFTTDSVIAAPPRGAAVGGYIKIGIVDMQRVLRDSKTARASRAAFEKELESRRAQIAAKEKEVRNLEGEIGRLDPSVPPEVKRQKADKLKHEIRELNNLRQDIEEELKRKDIEMSQKVIGDIMTVVRTFARNEKFTAIFERNAVMAADEAIDITDRILKLYDQKK